MALTEGQVIGRYKIVSQIGFGGMATVYKAYHARLDRFVAIKMMHAAFQEDQNFHARFEREAQIVARLEHPHIIPIYDFAELEGQPYLVMKYVEGRTLKAALYQKALPLAEIVRIMSALAVALDYAHGQGVLHRDIKPSNIILSVPADETQLPTPYLTDFGLARMAQLGDSTLSSDMLLGTPHYISPEQAMGSRELTPRTDLYSFAVVLYELLVGRVPFMSDTPFAVVHSHIYSPLPKPSTVHAEITPAVDAVLLKALAKDPEERYQTAIEMINAFSAALAESNMPELDPNRIYSAMQNTASEVVTPPTREEPNTGKIRSRLSAPTNTPPVETGETPVTQYVFADHSDPEMTVPPTALPRADQEVSQAANKPQAANKQTFDPDALGATAGKFIGEAAANIAVHTARFANSAINEAKRNIKDADIQIRINEESPDQRKRKNQSQYANAWDDVKGVWNDIKSGNIDTKEIGEELKAIFTDDGEIASIDIENEEAIRKRLKKQNEERIGFFAHAAIYTVIIFGMFGSQFISPGEDFFWPMIPALAWGAGLAAHGLETYFNTGERERRRIRAVNNEYHLLYGENWRRVSKKELKKVRNRVLEPFKQRHEFMQHAVVFVLINLMLLYINFSTTQDFPWALIPMAGWGIGLGAHFFETFVSHKPGKSLENAVERERALLANEKFKNDRKYKNDEYITDDRDFDAAEVEVRLTDDGEFTDSTIQQMESSQRNRRRQ